MALKQQAHQLRFPSFPSSSLGTPCPGSSSFPSFPSSGLGTASIEAGASAQLCSQAGAWEQGGSTDSTRADLAYLSDDAEYLRLGVAAAPEQRFDAFPFGPIVVPSKLADVPTRNDP